MNSPSTFGPVSRALQQIREKAGNAFSIQEVRDKIKSFNGSLSVEDLQDFADKCPQMEGSPYKDPGKFLKHSYFECYPDAMQKYYSGLFATGDVPAPENMSVSDCRDINSFIEYADKIHKVRIKPAALHELEKGFDSGNGVSYERAAEILNGSLKEKNSVFEKTPVDRGPDISM